MKRAAKKLWHVDAMIEERRELMRKFSAMNRLEEVEASINDRMKNVIPCVGDSTATPELPKEKTTSRRWTLRDEGKCVRFAASWSVRTP